MTARSRRGIGVSPGVAIGRAMVLERRISHVPQFDLSPDRVDEELARLDAAVEGVRRQLAEIEQKAGREMGSGIAQIIDAQRLMLEDSSFVEPIRERIRKLGQNAEWAVKAVGDDLSARFARISNAYLRERRNDLDDLANRLLRTLTGKGAHALTGLKEPVVLFAYDLSPSDTAMLDRRLVLAFATDVGGRTSHTAIMARSMEIPAVVGLHDATRRVRTGDAVVLDGAEGMVIFDPSAAQIEEYRNKESAYRDHERELLGSVDLPSVTPDGLEVVLAANIESADEIQSARRHGAAGVGLFRSEFLYLRARDDLPDEEAHYTEYRAVLEAMAPHPVTIRTLDLGGEKELPGHFAALRGDNALLGLRAIRHSLRERAMFETQLRGLLRASPFGRLRVVFPFVSGVEELRAARSIFERVREALIDEGHEVSGDLAIGVMLEVPAAALIVDHLASEVDFFSIGTNDLIQYLLAVDRNNDAVAHLYEPLHPAVLRLLDGIVAGARAHRVPVSLCGETAADPLTAMIMLGFGIAEFSMSPTSIPVIKNLVRRMPFAEARRILEHALDLGTAQEVEEFALEQLMAHFPDGFLVGR